MMEVVEVAKKNNSDTRQAGLKRTLALSFSIQTVAATVCLFAFSNGCFHIIQIICACVELDDSFNSSEFE